MYLPNQQKNNRKSIYSQKVKDSTIDLNSKIIIIIIIIIIYDKLT